MEEGMAEENAAGSVGGHATSGRGIWAQDGGVPGIVLVDEEDECWGAGEGDAIGAGGWRCIMSPAVSEKQRRFMGAELARKRAGKKTKTGMSVQQLREYASSGGKDGTTTKGSRQGKTERRKEA